jgi:hypothetical protein
MKRIHLLLLIADLVHCVAAVADPLVDGFANPPNATRAGVWWRWIDGNITREGITRDLTEMSRKGIRSVDLFDVGGGV